jgi:diguanylate cyclase (GGDEF)-like protein
MENNTCSSEMQYSFEESKKLSKIGPECQRKIFLIKLFGLTGILITLPFGILSLINGNEILAISLILISILLGGNYFLVAKRSNYQMAAHIIVYLFLFLFLYLVYSGGVANTGSLWIYAFPALALFLHGLKQGLIDIAIFIVLLLVMFVGFEDYMIASYSNEYMLRLIFTFMVVTFLSSLYEYSHEKFFVEMNTLTEKLINAAKQDQLTELANRRGIYEEIEEMYKQAKEKGEELCVMLCDINFLHDINYKYGYDFGDHIIKQVAAEIQNSIKNTHTLAQWSGEEFLILLPETKLEDAHKFSLALEKRIKNLDIRHDRERIKVSISTGISDVKSVKSIYAAIRKADNEMYST